VSPGEPKAPPKPKVGRGEPGVRTTPPPALSERGRSEDVELKLASAPRETLLANAVGPKEAGKAGNWLAAGTIDVVAPLDAARLAGVVEPREASSAPAAVASAPFAARPLSTFARPGGSPPAWPFS
jgi:hypothetical protein